MKRCLLDSSFVIDLLNEAAAAVRGPARRWLDFNRRAELWISPVTYAEVLEGATDPAAARGLLQSCRWQLIGRQQADWAARNQRRAPQRLGENDAWQVATAQVIGATIVGHDPKAFARPGIRYDDHRSAP
jgi:predicted nucleic acid-binding protein